MRFNYCQIKFVFIERMSIWKETPRTTLLLDDLIYVTLTVSQAVVLKNTGSVCTKGVAVSYNELSFSLFSVMWKYL